MPCGLTLVNLSYNIWQGSWFPVVYVFSYRANGKVFDLSENGIGCLFYYVKGIVIMSSFLVTGGCGFIGSHLTDQLLERGHKVRILDDLSTGKRSNVSEACEIVVGDVSDEQMVKQSMAGMDGCFHLAAIASVQRSNEEWVRTHQVNLTGSVNVFEAARSQQLPVVYASSAAVYGDNPNMPLVEAADTLPITAYGADKLGSEQHGRVATLAHGVPTVGLRFFNVYGPRQDPASPYSGVISIFMDRIMGDKPLTVFGDGLQTRDFVYVADVVRFLMASMEQASDTPKVFNVCTGKSVTINELADTLIDITGNSVEVSHLEARKGDIRISLGNPEKAATELSIRAENDLRQGLSKLVDFVRTDSE